MFNVDKLVTHWLEDANSSWLDVDALLQSKRYSFAAFAAHLAVEKVLKACVALETKDIPSRTHNLLRLVELAKLDMSEQQRDFLSDLNDYQLEGRYRDSHMAMPSFRRFWKISKKQEE